MSLPYILYFLCMFADVYLFSIFLAKYKEIRGDSRPLQTTVQLCAKCKDLNCMNRWDVMIVQIVFSSTLNFVKGSE